MKKIVALLGALALCVVAAGCGGGNACVDTCEKVKSCLQNVSCDGLDALAKTMCEASKATYQNMDCGKLGDACEGQAKEAADALNKCDFDSKTCTCKQ